MLTESNETNLSMSTRFGGRAILDDLCRRSDKMIMNDRLLQYSVPKS